MTQAALAPSPWLPFLRTGGYRKLASALKTGAAPTGDGEYEKALAQLGMSIIQSRVAELMPSLKGFQLLDKDEEGEKAAGFFVFDVKGTIIDIPVFMLQGRIKGYQMMFMRDRQAFLPAREGLIKYLMSAQHQSMGQVGPGEMDMRPTRVTPNVDVFTANNRYLQKAASYPSHFTPWGRQSGVWEDVLSIHADPRTSAVYHELQSTRKLACRPLRPLLARPEMARKLAQWCQQSPRLKARVEKALGADWAVPAMTPKAARAPISLNRVPRIELASRPARSPSVSIYTGMPSDGYKTASGDCVADKLEFGHFVVDGRPEGMTKTALKIQRESGWAPPEQTDLRRVAMTDGQSEQCLVILPQSILYSDPGQARYALVVAKDGSGIVRVPLSDLPVESGEVEEFAAPEAKGDAGQIPLPGSQKTAALLESYQSWVDGLPSVGSLQVPEDAFFIVIDSAGRMSPLLKSYGGNSEGSLSVSPREPVTVGKSTTAGEGDCCGNREVRYDGPIRRVRVTDTVRRLTPVTPSQIDGSYGTELLVPEDAKILKIKTGEDDYRPASLPVLPLSDMSWDEITKKAHFTIQKSVGGYYRLGQTICSTPQTRQQLLALGLSKEASAQVMREATTAPQRYAVVAHGSQLRPWQLLTPMAKAAYGPVPQNVSIFNGDMPETPMSMSPGMMPVAEQQPISAIEQAPLDYANPMDPNWSSEFAPYNQPMMTQSPGGGGPPTAPESAISQLNGSSEGLFENTLFLSLLRHGRVDSALSQLTESLYEVADRLSRELFLMYAHQDEFIDRYGRTDVELMEEQSLGLLDSTGDMLVDLLQRSVDPSNDIALASTGQI